LKWGQQSTNSSLANTLETIQSVNQISSNRPAAIHKRSLTNEQEDNSRDEEDIYSKRAFKFGKRAYLLKVPYKFDDKYVLENKKAFKFGKKSIETFSSTHRFESPSKEGVEVLNSGKDAHRASIMDENTPQNEKRAFKFGKKSVYILDAAEDHSKTDKRRFKFGKKSVNGDVYPITYGNEAEEVRRVEKRAFKFGKKANETDVDETDANFSKERRAFKFGKREGDDEVFEKRAFKFGKRVGHYADVGENEKRAFKFGKRNNQNEISEPEENVDKQYLPSSNKLSTNNIGREDFDKRSSIKFGNKSDSSFPPWMALPIKQKETNTVREEAKYGKKAFKFGKKSQIYGENYDINQEPGVQWVDNKRAFKFGKKSNLQNLGGSKSSHKEDRRMFKFGKKSSDGFARDLSYSSGYPKSMMNQLLLQEVQKPGQEMHVTGVKRYLKPGRRLPGYFPEDISWINKIRRPLYV